jgi:glycosyltransferase involved in cell wall biosynthesis
MEFFFVWQNLEIKLTDNRNLTLKLEIAGKDYRFIPENEFPLKYIYFITKDLVPVLKQANTKLNSLDKKIPVTAETAKIDNVNFLDKETYYRQFLAEKDLMAKGNKAGKKGNKLNLAFIFDINGYFPSELISSITENLQFLFKNLLDYYPDLQMDIFSIFFSEWLDLLVQVPVTNLFYIPEKLELLNSYDYFIKFSEIMAGNQIDKTKINSCLEKLTPLKPSRKISPHPAGNNDLVSVIMPTFNRAGYLAETVKSFQNQSYKNTELVIIDDGSTDNTRETVEKFLSDHRLKYFFQKNKGVSKARNNGIMKAKGKYLMFLDDDDLFFPFTIEKLISFFKRQPETVKLVYGDLVYLFEDKKIFRREISVLAKPELFISYITGNNFSTNGVFMAETESLRAVGMYDESYLNSEDALLISQIVFKYDIVKINIPVILYRLHESQTTKNIGRNRYYADKTSLRYWYQLNAAGIQLIDVSGYKTAEEKNYQLAKELEAIAFAAFNSYAAHYDTTLEILKYAQKIHFSEKRQKDINFFAEKIPFLIRENYKSDLRISEAEKAILKKQFDLGEADF